MVKNKKIVLIIIMTILSVSIAVGVSIYPTDKVSAIDNDFNAGELLKSAVNDLKERYKSHTSVYMAMDMVQPGETDYTTTEMSVDIIMAYANGVSYRTVDGVAVVNNLGMRMIEESYITDEGIKYGKTYLINGENKEDISEGDWICSKTDPKLYNTIINESVIDYSSLTGEIITDETGSWYKIDIPPESINSSGYEGNIVSVGKNDGVLCYAVIGSDHQLKEIDMFLPSKDQKVDFGSKNIQDVKIKDMSLVITYEPYTEDIVIPDNVLGLINE